MSGTYEYYLENVLNSYSGAVAMASLWYVYFDLGSLQSAAGGAGGYLNSKESGANWNSGGPSLSETFQANLEKFTGCVFARQVTLPDESVGVTSGEGLQFGSYQGGLTVTGGRTGQSGLSITFMESQSSFVDQVLRPWCVRVGYNGLIASQKDKVLCKTLRACYLARTGTGSPLQVRKTFTFYDVVPIRVGGFTNSQTEEGVSYTSVDFAYFRYDVQ